MYLHTLFAVSWRGVLDTDPHTHEAVFEDDPGQEEDESLVAAVEC